MLAFICPDYSVDATTPGHPQPPNAMGSQRHRSARPPKTSPARVVPFPKASRPSRLQQVPELTLKAGRPAAVAGVVVGRESVGGAWDDGAAAGHRAGASARMTHRRCG